MDRAWLEPAVAKLVLAARVRQRFLDDRVARPRARLHGGSGPPRARRRCGRRAPPARRRRGRRAAGRPPRAPPPPPPARARRAGRVARAAGRPCARARSSRSRARSARPTRRACRGTHAPLRPGRRHAAAPATRRRPRRRAPPRGSSPDTRRQCGCAPSRPATDSTASGSPASACVTCSAASSGSARTGASLERHRLGSPRSTRPDPRVEARVEDVDERAHDRDEEGAVDHGRHDHRQVERGQRVVGEPADPRQPEDDLGQQCAAADEDAEVEAEERHERDQRVAQHVPDEHARAARGPWPWPCARSPRSRFRAGPPAARARRSRCRGSRA